MTVSEPGAGPAHLPTWKGLRIPLNWRLAPSIRRFTRDLPRSLAALCLCRQHKKSSNPLSLPQLERHLFKAADLLRGEMDASKFKELNCGMPFLERCADV